MERLGVRLDAEGRRRLDVLVENTGETISEIVRRLIDDAYEGFMQKRRIQAVERLTRLEVEAPPDPDTLARELSAAHEPGGLT